jgi:predicted TIM-barrel fold metal-dependent hydrolase
MGYEHLKDYDLPRVLGREVDLTVATTRLIAGGIFDRFPNLKVVVAHFGGGIAAVKDRLVGKGYRFGTLQKPFAEYFSTETISTWQVSRAAWQRFNARCRGSNLNA